MDCQNVDFSPQQSQKRIEKALQVLPSLVLKRILFFSLYLLGAKQNVIASLFEIPQESIKTAIGRVMKDGFSALRDRRESKADLVEILSDQQKIEASVLIENGFYTITFAGRSHHQLKIPKGHKVLLRSVLLSLLQANLLTIQKVSSVLGISVAHCRELIAKLADSDVTDVLVDKRKGQKQDFRVDLKVKGELIQNFAARSVAGYSISSESLTNVINATQNTTISARTIRWHMNKLGLMKIKKSLPKLVEALKKNSKSID